MNVKRICFEVMNLVEMVYDRISCWIFVKVVTLLRFHNSRELFCQVNNHKLLMAQPNIRKLGLSGVCGCNNGCVCANCHVPCFKLTNHNNALWKQMSNCYVRNCRMDLRGLMTDTTDTVVGTSHRLTEHYPANQPHSLLPYSSHSPSCNKRTTSGYCTGSGRAG
jgi:hypothetical protein